ncbi:Hint domain-containing protein, partial [Commensalibacter intestini]|uniref:Hint domain-containing protein n=1 Tax=Commensalibacter intestini TaxID=479936 RepID=UPI0005908D75
MSVTSGSNDLNSVVESDYASSNIVVNGASMISPADEVMPPIVSVATVISSGETMSGIALLPGGELSVLSGGITSSILIDGGTQSILSGGIDTNVLIDNGQQYVIGGVVTSAWLSVAVNVLQPGSTVIGNSVFQYATNTAIQYVSAGGVVDGVTIWESVGGWMDGGQTLITLGEAKQYVLDGGTVANAIVSAGTQYISSGGVVNHVMLSGYMGHYFSYPATQYVYDGGVTNNTFLASTAQQYVYSGGGATSTTIYSLGSSFVDVGGVTSDVTINGGYLQLDGTVSGSMIIRNGGYASIGSDGKIEGNVILSAGGSMTIGMSNGGTIDLVGDQNKGLVISGYVAGQNDSMTTVISGLTADSNKQVTVDGLQGANVSSVAYPDDNHITLQLLDGTSLTLNIVGIKESGYTLGSDASGDLTMIVCFLSGTLIKMAKGVCAVEDLQVGDTILTYDPQSKAKVKKKITWVGKQTAHVNAKLPDDQAGYPVRILKDAFKKNVPNKDLLITSEHCLFIDGHFVPA